MEQKPAGAILIGAMVTAGSALLLNQIAVDRGTTVSDLIRQALTESLPEMQATADQITPKGKRGRPKGYSPKTKTYNRQEQRQLAS